MNLGEGLTNESGAYLRRINDREIEGMKFLGTFCYNPQAVFPIYFVMRINKAPKQTGYWKFQRKMTGWKQNGTKTMANTNCTRSMTGIWLATTSVHGSLSIQKKMNR